MVSPWLWKGNTVSFGLKISGRCCKDLGFPISGPMFSEPLSETEFRQSWSLPLWVSLLFWESDSLWRVYCKLFSLGWWCVCTELSLFPWHFCCAQQTWLHTRSKWTEFFAELSVPGRIQHPLPRPTLFLGPLNHAQRKTEWEALRIYPSEQTTQATGRDAVISHWETNGTHFGKFYFIMALEPCIKEELSRRILSPSSLGMHAWY